MLANSGVNPITGERVLKAELVDEVLSVMLLSGVNDECGRWAYNVGLPDKSGLGGMRAIAQVARELELSLFKDRSDLD